MPAFALCSHSRPVLALTAPRPHSAFHTRTCRPLTLAALCACTRRTALPRACARTQPTPHSPRLSRSTRTRDRRRTSALVVARPYLRATPGPYSPPRVAASRPRTAPALARTHSPHPPRHLPRPYSPAAASASHTSNLDRQEPYTTRDRTNT
jgi:hypothetical protein